VPSIKVSEESYEKVITGSSKPVVLDFYADWCPDCRRISSAVESIADEYSEKVSIGKVNVDENEGLSDRFDIMSIPTLVLVVDNKVVDSLVGPKTKDDMVTWMNSNGVI